MEGIVLYDGPQRNSLLPLTYLRPIALCPVGIRTIARKWQDDLGLPVTHLTQDYLQSLFPYKPVSADEHLFINGGCLPSDDLISVLSDLNLNEVVEYHGIPIAFKAKAEQINALADIERLLLTRSKIHHKSSVIRFPEDLLNFAGAELIKDYRFIYDRRSGQNKLDDSVKVRGKDLLVGNKVLAYDAIINTTDGPVIIDDDAEVMEGAVIKGPAYIGNRSKVHVGAKIYGNTILGTECRVGGEIKRTIIFGYTNKAHDGYLGDSILGNWCNLGADTNNSNMKNTYGNVSLYDIDNASFRTTSRQFLGMVLGDHTMAAINTSFNTGSVTGVCTNILDPRPPRYVPSFTWGDGQKYRIDKAVEVATHAMNRRGLTLSVAYEQTLRYLSEQK